MPLADLTNQAPEGTPVYAPCQEDLEIVGKILDESFPKCDGEGISSSSTRSCACGAEPPCLFRAKEIKKALHDAAAKAGPDSPELRTYLRLCMGSSIQRMKEVVDHICSDEMLTEAKVKGFRSAQRSIWFGRKQRDVDFGNEPAAVRIAALLGGATATSVVGLAATAAVLSALERLARPATRVQGQDLRLERGHRRGEWRVHVCRHVPRPRRVV